MFLPHFYLVCQVDTCVYDFSMVLASAVGYLVARSMMDNVIVRFSLCMQPRVVALRIVRVSFIQVVPSCAVGRDKHLLTATIVCNQLMCIRGSDSQGMWTKR